MCDISFLIAPIASSGACQYVFCIKDTGVKMKAKFLGRSEKKFTCNAKWDYCILIENLKEFPHELMVKQHAFGSDWRMPFNGKQWAIHAIPTSMTSMKIYFGGYENPDIYQDFYDESEDSFEVTVIYPDDSKEVATTVDGRKRLTVEEEIVWLQSKHDWPAAVNPMLIADDTSETDKLERAEGILDHFADFRLSKMKFLDFGCGEGHLARKSLEKGVLVAVGYDPHVESDITDKLIITPDFNKVIFQAPYDFIMLYDVLDHAEKETPIDILEKIKGLSKSNTIIKIRCHPWISRHGGHQYKKTNKAFSHLVFNEKELAPESISTLKLNNPLETYKEWFAKTGFQIKSENIIKEPVESFFKSAMIKRRIMVNQGMNVADLANLDCSFVDYELVLF